MCASMKKQKGQKRVCKCVMSKPIGPSRASYAYRRNHRYIITYIVNDSINLVRIFHKDQNLFWHRFGMKNSSNGFHGQSFWYMHDAMKDCATHSYTFLAVRFIAFMCR
mmetsp:Transcript_17077/g.39476  ORF Transcript_17077/g.39476 Transcript_17077/m.39476 type:complete len:108 (+) Transcript_17077:493-816(+)